MGGFLTAFTDDHSLISNAPRGAASTLEERRGHAPKIKSQGYFPPVEIAAG